MKKIISLALSAVILISAFTSLGAVSASAETQEGRIYYYGYASDGQAFADKYYDLIEYAAELVDNFEESLNLTEYNRTAETPLITNSSNSYDTMVMFRDVLLQSHPELFYLKNFSWYLSSGQVTNILFIYNYTDDVNNDSQNSNDFYSKADTVEMKKAFEEKTQAYLKKVDSSMSDFEKALILHDELVINSAYKLTDPDGHEVDTYMLMVKEFGDCDCYAGAYSYLLKRCGVDTEQIVSESMAHQWSKVKIDGKWYNVDVTWDDPTLNHENVEAHVKHNFFLYTDSAFQDSSVFTYADNLHTDYNTLFVSDDDRFDSYELLHSLSSRLCYVNNQLYMSRNVTNEGGIYTYDYLTDTKSDRLVEINDRWQYRPDPQYSWNGVYSTIDSQDGYIYYNTPSAIYVYDTVDGSTERFWDNTESDTMDIYGLRIIGNTVYAAESEDPNSARTLVQADECKKRTVPYVTSGGEEISLTAEFERDAEDTTNFGISNVFKNIELLGVQVKNSSNGEESRSVRFVSVLKDTLLQDAADYGFIAVAAGSKAEARELANDLTLDNAPARNVFSCGGTDNNVSGDYGVHNSDKTYKYVTFAVNNLRDYGVAAVFYIKDTNNNVFYAPYTDSLGDVYNNCAVDWNAILQAQQ